MSRPRTLTAILDTKGAFLAQPGRRRDGEPQPTGSIGSAPKHFTDDEKKIWREFVRGLPTGVGKSSDRWAAESIVRLKAKERAGKIQGNELAQLTSLYGRFGMTPSDRAKVSVERRDVVSGARRFRRNLSSRDSWRGATPARVPIPLQSNRSSRGNASHHLGNHVRMAGPSALHDIALRILESPSRRTRRAGSM
jgi:hypothetical protein